jgi:hypothetical protein
VIANRAATKFDPDGVTLNWIVKAGSYVLDPRMPDELPYHVIAARKSPWSDLSLGRLFRQRIKASLDSVGRFATTVPAIRGVVITASHHGFKPAQAEVPFSTALESVEVGLRLEPSLRIGGTLRTSSGRPVKGCRFRIYSVVFSPPGVVDRGALLAHKPRGGLTVSAGANGIVVRYGYSASTDDEGRFSAFVGVPGQLVVVADAPGQGPLRHELGLASHDIDDLELVLPAASEQARIKILDKGVPLRSAALLLGDLNPLDGYAQHASRVRLDEDGVLATGNLIRGRKYFLGTLDPVPATSIGSGWFAWVGQETIDLADLRPVSELRR